MATIKTVTYKLRINRTLPVVKIVMLKGEKGDPGQGTGEPNVIEVIKVNGTTQPVNNKAVNIPVPTDTDDLTNSAGFLSSSDISGGVASGNTKLATGGEVYDAIDTTGGIGPGKTNLVNGDQVHQAIANSGGGLTAGDGIKIQQGVISQKAFLIPVEYDSNTDKYIWSDVTLADIEEAYDAGIDIMFSGDRNYKATSIRFDIDGSTGVINSAVILVIDSNMLKFTYTFDPTDNSITEDMGLVYTAYDLSFDFGINPLGYTEADPYEFTEEGFQKVRYLTGQLAGGTLFYIIDEWTSEGQISTKLMLTRMETTVNSGIWRIKLYMGNRVFVLQANYNTNSFVAWEEIQS